MKTFKQAAVVIATVGMVSMQAHAGEAAIKTTPAPQPMAAFSQQDINGLFDQADRPMQLAALSKQEMKETEGAWVWNIVGWTVGGGAVGAGTYLWTTPRSQWSWAGAGRAFGSGATAGFYNSMVPLRALGAAGSYVMGAVGAASWYR